MTGVRIYRALLRLFPASFRRQDADDAVQTFEALLREAPDRWARARVVIRCVAALPRAAAAEWWEAARARIAGSPERIEGGRTMDGMWQQSRWSVRALGRTPSFTVSAVVLLGLGVGAVTAVFTLVDHILLRPLPYPAAERLAYVENGNHSGPLFERMTDMRTVERWVAARGETTNLLTEGEPLRLRAARVSEDFFDVFAGRAALGRLFTASDFSDAGGSVVVDAGAWQRIWGGDPELVGRTILLDGRPVTVVGIVYAGFTAPEAMVGSEVALWRPLDWSSDILTSHTAWILSVSGRLVPGASFEAANEEMRTVMADMAPVHENYRNNEGGPRALPMAPLVEFTVRDVRAGLGLLLGAVVMLLLVACANVAQLFLARGLGRAREMAVRRALGAGTGVLLTQLMLESVLVGLAGGLVGLGLGWAGLQGFLALTPEALPRQAAVALDLRMLAFAIAIAVATALVFGLLPALRSVGRDPADTLRGADRSATSGRGVGTLRRGLVIGEVALSLVLVAGAGLLFRSFLLVHGQSPGVRTADIWTVPLSLTDIDTPEAWMRTMASIGDAVSGVAGVESVTYGLTMPLASGGGRCCWRTPVTADEGASASPMLHPVSPSYFQTLEIPVRAGRGWREAESRVDPMPVVVSERVALELWGGAEAAVGRRLESEDLSMIVLGVAGDVRHYGIEDDPDPAIYLPAERLPFAMDRAHLALRLRPGSSASLGQDLRRAIWGVAPGVPIPVVRSMDEWLAMGTSGRRFDSALFSTFAALALVLAAGGLYGTLLYLASQRRRELGIRMALGASRARIERDVVRGGVGMALAGVLLGLGGSWALGRFLEARLWGVGASDLTTLAGAALLLLATAGLASWLPARRAGRIDPVQTLRIE